MAATTTERITSLIQHLSADSTRCPHLNGLVFESAGTFGWHHSDTKISYDPSAQKADAYLLHEYGHALLGHNDYSHDVTLLEMERAAWDQAATLAARYDVALDYDTIEDSLDTYRDWLHARSTCPNCNATGVQSSKKRYHCLACRASWNVNDARTCTLRRYKDKK